MFIDTHCHLTDEYAVDTDSIIGRAAETNVGVMICATANPRDIPSALALAQRYKNIFATVGIHPDYWDTDADNYLTDDVLNNPLVIGVGEIGLDYHNGKMTRDRQIKLFEQQLEIAHNHNMPVAIHTRDAEDDTTSILTDKNFGVMHCFTSNWDLARVMLDRGFYFSASGILTFKNAELVRETFAKIPNDRIVIETDSPFCAPVPHRGKKCEPYMIIETAKILAQIKNLKLDELENILFENTKRLYPKIKI